ncbi:MAG: HIT family protein [Ectothiorhodospiraceae bacterium]|nr:HIT family protein [Ectothiorhodospiraceae bacterium]MCH8503926.1 HIT family protein [Ectothiorhodospiraceae bacterium]
MSDCIFCRIQGGDEPASVVYEDALCVAFMDIYPASRGHVLVIPRQHAVFLHELPAETQQHLFRIGCRILTAQQEAGVPWQGATVLVNDGPAAGQHVPHVHLHLLPRVRGDRLRVMFGFMARSLNFFGRAAKRRQLDADATLLREHMGQGGAD